MSEATPPDVIVVSAAMRQVFEQTIAAAPPAMQRILGLLEGKGVTDEPYTLEIREAVLVRQRKPGEDQEAPPPRHGLAAALDGLDAAQTLAERNGGRRSVPLVPSERR